MTFLQLKYIVTVAECGSISVAARKLMISQPSLSQSIRNVEKEYNVTLFDRGGTAITPTKAGLVFLQKANLILDQMQQLAQELEQLETEPKELRIGISDAGMLINKHIIRKFQQLCPEVKLLLVERDPHHLERMLESGKLDMIFTMAPEANPELEVVPLVEDEFLIALPRTHPVARQWLERLPDLLRPDGKQLHFPMIDLGECQDACFVLSVREQLNLAQLSALRTAFEPQISFETDTLASALSIAAYEPYGAIVPKLFSLLYDGSEQPIFFHCSRQLPLWRFAMSVKKGKQMSEAGYRYAGLFISYIHELGLLDDPQAAKECLGRLKKRM